MPARTQVVEKVPLRKYELGPSRCSRTPQGACGVVAFLASRKDVCQGILEKLQALPAEAKSQEIKNTQDFLRRLTKSPGSARQDDPCLTVGDLLIALESVGVPNFFTLNSAESQHFCRILEQTLIVQPIDPLKPEVVCHKEDKQWPKFGKLSSPSTVDAGRGKDQLQSD